MNLKTAVLSAVAVFGLAAGALADRLEKGTPVTLAFDDAVNSKHVHSGDTVHLHVYEDVRDGGRVVIRRGTRVTAIITDVQKNGRFGKNAQLKLSINPIRQDGVEIPLQPRQKGNIVGGSKGTEAAGVAGAGAVVLGPVGLAAGYFVVGKSVNVHPGDKLETQVSSDVRLH